MVRVTAITEQTNQKNKFESVVKQRFQIYSWLRVERKVL